MVGGAAELLDQVVAYVKDRKQFGVPVGGFQAVQHRAADMLIRIEKARSAVYHAALVADEAPAELPLAASAAKVAANQAYVWCSQQAIQLYGGLGFTWEQDLHLHFKRAKASEYLLGSTAYHLDRIAEVLGIA
jgi:alkylation response protein AidB-like acyl-CoA dehydrogenase